MSNPLDIKWPQDQYGNLSRFKAEGLKAVERMHGNDAKLEAFIATIRTLAKHANARFATQVKRRAELVAQVAEAAGEVVAEVDSDAKEPVVEKTPEVPVAPEPEKEPEPENT